MNPIQKWLFFCAACLAYLWALGVPVEALRSIPWILSAVSVLGLVADVAMLKREDTP